jgi:hypothetical protein
MLALHLADATTAAYLLLLVWISQCAEHWTSRPTMILLRPSAAGSCCCFLPAWIHIGQGLDVMPHGVLC